ncbi:MAG TPA: cytochrome b/b6 domain-containing protein [Pedobacter sp.]
MSIPEPIHQDLENRPQTKKYAATIRFWHWTNTLVISGSLVTVLINSTLFEEETVKAMPQGKSIFHTLEDKVWGIHIYFGYALAVLFLFRMVLELSLPDRQKFWRKMKIAYQDYFVSKRNRDLAKHEFAVKVLYLVFYGLLMIMTLTGLTLAFEDQLGIPKSLAHSVKEFHGFCMYLIIIFILVHIAGVFMAERKDNKGIVSDMINGGKDA